MVKYAICFKHNACIYKNYNRTIKEYFRPYPPQVLIEIVKEKKLKRMLQHAIDTQQTFEGFIERYNLQDRSYIVQISDDEITKNTLWINNEWDYNELSMWDYLAEARAIYDAVRFGQEQVHLANHTAYLTMKSRLVFDYLKLIISILVYTDVPGSNNSNHKNKPPSDLSPEIRTLLNEIYYELNNFNLLNILSWRERIHEYIIRHEEEIDTVLMLKKIDKLFEDFIIKSNFRRPDTIRRKFIQIIFVENNTLFKYLKEFIDISILHEFDNTIFDIFLSKNLNLIIPTTMNYIIKYVVEAEEALNTIIEPDHKKIFNLLKDSFEKKAIKIVSSKYTVKYSECGCFAIIITNSSNKYFSLSGSKELSDNASKMVILANYINDNILNSEYKWCPVNENTPRFTQILNSHKERPDLYISNAKKLENDFDIKSHLTEDELKKIGFTYGCCERKIMGYIEDLTSIEEIYSRWAPCWKCRPAVYNKPYKIYAFSKNFEEWSNIEDKASIHLKRYTVYQIYHVSHIP